MNGSTCVKCGKPIPADRRSDAAYCDDGCKGAARLERKRLDTRLLELERNLSSARIHGFPAAQVARYQREVDAAEARLKALLGR